MYRIPQNFRNLYIVAFFLVVGLVMIASPRSIRAETGAACREVVEYRDLNADGLPEAMVLDCQFSEGTQDRLTIHKPAGQISADTPWEQNITFEDETWVFDHGAQGRASLIIQFRRDGEALVAELFDDRTGDGEVSYKVVDGRVEISETSYWTVQVVAPDGWWMKDGRLNYNLHILVDGDVEGMFMISSYRDDLVTDGEPDFQITIYDQNLNGRPEYDRRMILTPWLQEANALQTQMMANWNDNEVPISGGFDLWPYLNLVSQSSTGSYVPKPYHGSPPPIIFVPSTGRVEAMGEFVASRAGEDNCFFYSGLDWEPGKLNEANFETPFCFYDLAQDGDGIPELQVRSLYYVPHDRYFLNGGFSGAYQVIRYSWDQKNEGTWRYAVGMIGRHEVDDIVDFAGIDVLTIPYEEFPSWVTERRWDMAVFSEFTGKSYFTSEGDYSVSYPEDKRFAEYFSGISSDKPSPEYEPDAEFRMEWAIDYLKQLHLYFSPIDHRLHLKGAQGGAWNLGEAHYIKYANLDGDDYIDQWQAERNGKVVQQLNYGHEVLILSGEGRIEIVESAVIPSSFETLPPSNHEEWIQLEELLNSNGSALAATDIASMFDRFDGPRIQIEKSTLSDYRFTRDGFRFILELHPGFSAEYKQEDWVRLPENPGTYVVEYDGIAWSVQPFTPVSLRVDELQIVSRDEGLRAREWTSIEGILLNDGLEDARDLTICVSLRGPEQQQQVITSTVSLLPGMGEYRFSWPWAPEAAGSWTADIASDCEGSNIVGSIARPLDSTTVEVASSLKPEWGWFASLGGMVSAEPWLILFGLTSIIAGSTVFWLKGLARR